MDELRALKLDFLLPSDSLKSNAFVNGNGLCSEDCGEHPTISIMVNMAVDTSPSKEFGRVAKKYDEIICLTDNEGFNLDTLDPKYLTFLDYVIGAEYVEAHDTLAGRDNWLGTYVHADRDWDCPQYTAFIAKRKRETDPSKVAFELAMYLAKTYMQNNTCIRKTLICVSDVNALSGEKGGLQEVGRMAGEIVAAMNEAIQKQNLAEKDEEWG